MGTIGGNICNLAPSADSIAPLLVYDAKIKVLSVKDERIISLKDFLPNKISWHFDLKNDEILAEIILPFDENISKAKSLFFKLGRRKNIAISRMSFAILLKLDKNIVVDIRLAIGAVFPYPGRLYNIEKKYIGKEFTRGLSIDISKDIAREVLDKTGVRWSTAYKLPTLQQIVYNLLEQLKKSPLKQ